jgi:hypothetical protein
MTGSENRGNHELTFRFTPGQKSDTPARLLAERRGIRICDDAVMDAERAAIESRRARMRGDRDRTKCELTGVALSGGGIRSGSVALGALQGIEVAMQLDGSGGIDGIDYLSSVSGGGYVGCSLTNAMERAGGAFPFTEPKTYADTAAVRHIRDFSNYLIPRGGTDIVTAVAIVLRGLVANLIIVLPIIVGPRVADCRRAPDGKESHSAYGLPMGCRSLGPPRLASVNQVLELARVLAHARHLRHHRSFSGDLGFHKIDTGVADGADRLVRMEGCRQ